MLCAGLHTALTTVDGELSLYVYDLDRHFSFLTDCTDKQIQKITPATLAHYAYDLEGLRLVLTTKDGLVAVFAFNGSGQMYYSDDVGFPVVFKTFRIMCEDGRILPYRTALEDQWVNNVADHPHKNGLILVPFQVFINDRFVVARVQVPGQPSCIVRVLYMVADNELNELPTRQAFTGKDWDYIYELSIIDMALSNNCLYILTQVGLVEAWLGDYDPFPVLSALPKDRVNLSFGSDYLDFLDLYTKFKTSPFTVTSQPMVKIPIEWEVIYTTTPEKRDQVRKLLAARECSKPRPPRPLREMVTIMLDVDDPIQAKQFSGTADTVVNATCPWQNIVVAYPTPFVVSIEGVHYRRDKMWHLLERDKPCVNAVNCQTTVALQEELNWVSVDPEGNVTQLDGDPILAIYNDLVIAGKT